MDRLIDSRITIRCGMCICIFYQMDHLIHLKYDYAWSIFWMAVGVAMYEISRLKRNHKFDQLQDFDGLMQEKINSDALAMAVRHSCTDSSILYTHQFKDLWQINGSGDISVSAGRRVWKIVRKNSIELWFTRYRRYKYMNIKSYSKSIDIRWYNHVNGPIKYNYLQFFHVIIITKTNKHHKFN